MEYWEWESITNLYKCMELKKIQDAEVENKKVILRVGFDVVVEEGKIGEKFKIQAVKETLDYLIKRKAKVALMTWFGRPGGKKDLKFSLNQIKDEVGYILGCKIKFVPDCIGEEVKKAMNELEYQEVVLLENVRFYPGEGDVEAGKTYEIDFAQKLAAGFDLFVNDALSQSHRNQASIAGIPRFIPACAGLLLQKEIENLEKVKNDFERPAVAVIGGAKIETKLPVIKFFEEKYDNVLVGGKIANEAIDKKVEFSPKVILPKDFIDDRLDIGPETISQFQQIILEAKTIVWNGPVGKFEEEKYANGTQKILEAILKSNVYVVAGGGETLEALKRNQAMDKISFVSTGGGAMLEYLAGKKLPGIEALKSS